MLSGASHVLAKIKQRDGSYKFFEHYIPPKGINTMGDRHNESCAERMQDEASSDKNNVSMLYFRGSNNEWLFFGASGRPYTQLIDEALKNRSVNLNIGDTVLVLVPTLEWAGIFKLEPNPSYSLVPKNQ